MKKIIKLTFILLITILITTGCGVNKKAKLKCENKSIELTQKWLSNQGVEDYEIIKSEAHIGGLKSPKSKFNFNQKLTGTAYVTIKYKGVEKDILAYCNKRNDQDALDIMTRYHERSSAELDNEKNCIEYNDIKICSSSKKYLEDTNIKVVETTISNSEYKGVMDAYSITSDEKKQTYKIYIPIDKIQEKYDSLEFLDIQVSDNDTYTYPLSITNDFKYYKANFYIKDYEGIFTIVESK